MSIINGIKRSLSRLALTSNNQIKNIIVFGSVAGWMASSAAQIYGIATNKNYNKKQKKYMIKQEIFDAGTNIALYLSVTKSFSALSSYMVKTGKLAPKSIVEFMRRNGVMANRGKDGFDVTQVKDFDKEGLKGLYNSFKCFADTTATIIGGVVSSNIITPIVRNRFAARRQNNYDDNMGSIDTAKKQTTQKPAINTPRHTFDDFRSRTMNGSLRI